jgi:hypothetical protein
VPHHSSDPIVNAIQNGIKRSIQVLIENDCYPSSVVLIYTGMDTMAYLNMPATETYVKGKFFISWADRYIRFPCKEQVSGLELYNARNGVVHTYSSFSRGTDEGKSRVIGYMDHSIPEVIYKPNDKNLVMVSIKGLAEAFFKAVDQSLIDIFSDPDTNRKKVVEERLSRLNLTFPFKLPEADS